MRTLFVGLLFLFLIIAAAVSVFAFSYVDLFSPSTLRLLTKSVIALAALIGATLVIKLFFLPARTRNEHFGALFDFFRGIDSWAAMNVILVALTAAAALAALETYRQTNTIATVGNFEARDREIRNIYMTDKTARFEMMQVFANEPDLEDEEYKACTNATQARIGKWAQDYVADAIFAGQKTRPTAEEFRWNTIEELDEHFWSTERMRDERFALARALVMHASDYLYLVHDAMRARQSGYFSHDEYRVWGGYLDDLGPSPFFLAALRDEIKYGYFMPAIADALRAHFRSQPNLNCIARTLYPGFLDPKADND